MKNPLLLNIAQALLLARLKQSVVAAVGVTFGIGMFIALVSFMTGLNYLLDNLIINRTPHIRLYNEITPSRQQPVEMSPRYKQNENFIRSVKPKDEGREIYNSQKIIQAVKADPRVYDVAPRITTPVFFNTGGIEISGIVNGIDVPAEEKLFPLNDYILEGNLEDLIHVSNSIIIGKGIATKMLLELGDWIQVTTAQGEQATLKVAGIIQFGIAEIDETLSYTTLRTAQKLLGKQPGYVTDIQIKLHDLQQSPKVALEYSRIFEVDAIDIQTANSQFETGSNVRSIISYAVGITLLIVAGFGIYNILNMLIYEKMDSIAILKATGFSGSDVRRIFIYLSMIIGIAGGILGLVLGYSLSVIISNIPFETPSLPTIKTYPVNFNPVYYVIGIIFALLTTYLAGLLPALKASKVDPVTIIRGK